jgi:murein DD-endopeptidase MepM/ murein hydrolase activator NlpD
MKHPVNPETYNASNGFGQFDVTYYPATKHHIGSDYRLPVGTPIYAPCDGTVLKVVFNAARGNTAIFDFTHKGQNWGLELCHLRELPQTGSFKEGQQIAVSGNTGSATSGPHLHMVLHRDCRVTKNYQDLTSEGAFIRLWRDGRLADPYYYFWNNCT